MLIDNFNRCTDEQLCRAVFPGLVVKTTRYPDLLGDTCHVTTEELWRENKVLGSGTTRAQAWEDAAAIHHAEIWRRVREGAYTREIEEPKGE